MAEKSSPKKVFVENSQDLIECAVCLQTCVYPTILPCGHVFCFLCVKGLDRTTGICAMCRQQFPSDVLEKPSLLRPIETSPDSGFDDGQQWYYEGRHGGWWQYEMRISTEIEQAHRAGEKNVELIICGELYVVDLEMRVQYPKQNPTRRRKIQRSSVQCTKSKGWWQYDKRTSEYIEVAFKRGDKNCEVSIAGTIYVVDFEKMEQRQKLRNGRTRRIKRDSVSIEKKGISGIRAAVETSSNDDDTLSRLSRLNLGVP